MLEYSSVLDKWVFQENSALELQLSSNVSVAVSQLVCVS